MQRALVEDDGADVLGRVVETEEPGHEGRVLIDEAGIGALGQETDGLEVARGDAALTKSQGETEREGGLASATLGRGDVDRSHLTTPGSVAGRRRAAGVTPGPSGPAYRISAAGRGGPYFCSMGMISRPL